MEEEFGMMNAEFGVRNAECDSNDMEMAVQPEVLGREEEFGVRNAECDSNDMESEVQPEVLGRNAECDSNNTETEIANQDQDTLEKELLCELEAERARRIQAENKYECIRYLEEKGLPLSLINVIGENSLEAMKSAIDTLSQIVGERVRDEVKSRLTSVTPPPAKVMSPSYSDFQKMSLGDMQKIYSTDKQLYRELTNQFKK